MSTDGERGPRGDQGQRGERGSAGDRGERGSTGATGAAEKRRFDFVVSLAVIVAIFWLLHEKSLGTEGQIAGVVALAGIAGVTIWQRGKGNVGSAVALIASWPMAKLLGPLAATRWS